MSKLLLIAEIGQAHHGSLEKAHQYIDAVAQTGVDVIKFQTHIADAESSIYEPFRVKFSDKYATRFDYWKAMEFSLEEWKLLKTHCDTVGLEFMSSPFSNEAVDVLEQVGVKRYKVGSGEVNNFLLLEKIIKTEKPIIISSGMSSYEELDKTVSFLKARGAEFSIMQCTTSYPTSSNQIGFNVISELKERYNVKVGFSDHSAKIGAGIAAVANGAEILEFHIVLNKNEEGPDVSSSLTIDEAKDLVYQLRFVYDALEQPIDKTNIEHFRDLKQIFEKSLAVNKDLKAGHSITFSDLEAKKPANKGISASNFQKVLNRKVSRDISKWEFLNENDLEDIIG